MRSKFTFSNINSFKQSFFFPLFRDYESKYNDIHSECSEKLNQYLKSETQLQEYPVPVVELNGKRYTTFDCN